MADQKTRYTVEITRTGDGAAQAAQDFNKVEQAAGRTNKALANSTQNFQRVNMGAAASRQSLQSLTMALQVVGLQAFPQFTMAGMAGANAVSAVRSSALALGVGLGPVSVALASTTALVVAGSQAWQAYKAQVEAARTAGNAFAAERNLKQSVADVIDARVLSGQLSEVEAQHMRVMMRTAQGVRDVVRRLGDLKIAEGVAREHDKVIAQYDAFLLELSDKTKTGLERDLAASAAQLNAWSSKLRELKNSGVFNDAELAKVSEAIDNAFKFTNRTALEEEAKRQRAAQAQQLAAQIAKFERELTLQTLREGGSREAAALREYAARIAFAETYLANVKGFEDEHTAYVEQAEIKRLEAQRQAAAESQRIERDTSVHIMNSAEMRLQSLEMWTDGLSGAMVDFISGTKSAEQAFREFAASFLREIARMLIKAALLRIFAPMFGVPIGFAGGGVAMAASGGMFPRMMAAGGVAGVSEVSRPTYFPRHNVIAGEAGREMLTVLARPRFMEVGGMQAIVGNAGPNRLAITSADDLAGRGGGTVVVEIRHTPETEARIVENSVKGAVVRVTQEMTRDSELRRATKSSV